MKNGLHCIVHPEYEEKIEVQKSMMNRFAEEQPAKVQVLKAHFKKSCYYEWKFWEMPWTLEDWKGEVEIMSISKIRLNKSFVHCITNYVVANFTANGLLAIGASPVMADEALEVEEMVSNASCIIT